MKIGNTTKLVDRYIQELFTNKKTFVYEGRNTRDEYKLTEECFKIFKKRMLSEHSEVSYSWHYDIVDGIWCYITTLNV